jgi:hypothetical protein
MTESNCPTRHLERAAYFFSFSAAASSLSRSFPTRLVSASACSVLMPCLRAK